LKQRKILLDTCTYLRLAKSIHPLLGNTFGKENYCLYIIEDLQNELDSFKRLKDNEQKRNKFFWVDLPEFVANRQYLLNISNIEKGKIRDIYYFILEEVRDRISPTDIKNLATSKILDIPVVTDDKDMSDVGAEYKISAIKSIDLLNLMLLCEHIVFEDIENTISYLIFMNDLPGNFKKDYIRIFKKSPPIIK